MAYLINPLGQDEMRRLAKARLRRRDVDIDASGLPAAAQTYLEELTMSHLELELQNEHHEHSRMQMDQAVNQFRELYDFAPVPLLCLSAHGAITRLNFAAARSLAQERARLMGLDLSRFVHPNYTARLAQMLQTAYTSTESCRDELMLVIPDHPPQSWLASVTGKGDGTFSLALFDITQQQQEMENLRRQTEGWRTVVDATGVGTWDWHIPSGKISHSPCFGDLMGLSGDHHDLTRNLWRDKVHPDDWPMVLACIQNHLLGKTAAVVLSYRITEPAGGWQRVTLRGAVTERNADAGAVRMLGTLVAAD